MDWLWNILWFAGLWFVGNLVCGMLVTQVLIILRCAKKLHRKIRNDQEYWDPAACNRYLNRTVIIDSIITIAVSALVVWLVPAWGIYGYFIGVAFTLLLGLKSTGVNKDNAEESCKIFLRFAKPGKQEEMAELLPMLVDLAIFEAMLKK